MEEIFEFIKQYLGEAVVAIVTGLIAYLTGRRKANAELKQTEGSALQVMQEAYDKFTSDSLHRYEELSKELKEVKDMLKIVQEELDDCRRGILRGA